MSSHFVGRQKELEKFRQNIKSKKPTIYRIVGKPGIGKSSLIDQFRAICKSENYPNTYISFDTDSHFSDGIILLKDLVGRSSCCFGEIKDGKLQDDSAPWWSDFVSAVTETKFGKVADGTLKSAIALYKKIEKKDKQNIIEDATKTPELFLLNLLSTVGEKKPVIFIDAYEHLFNEEIFKIESFLDLQRSTICEYEKKEYKLLHYIDRLIDFLQSKGWHVVVTGRVMREEKKADKLEPFSDDDILSFASNYNELHKYITNTSSDAKLKQRKEDEDKVLKILKKLSFGG